MHLSDKIKNNKDATPRICACVVLYNPHETVLKNIKTLSTIVNKIFLVDNTEEQNFNNDIYRKLCSINNVVYVKNSDNVGIARALNIAAKEAQKSNFEFILTLDQDSEVKEDLITRMIVALHKTNIDLSTIGIISPFHQTHPDIYNDSSQEIIDKTVVMTSGNLLNLKAFEKSGDFWEDLFIDRVDHEYCLRLKKNGYRIIQINTVVLEHGLGNISKHRLFNKNYTTTNHSALRRYYQTRNMFYVIDKYKDIFPDYKHWEIENLIRELKTVLFFEKQKFTKLKMMLRGYMDYKKNVFGKYRG